MHSHFTKRNYTFTDMNIDLLSAEQTEQLKSLIKESENIVICCHKSPDGDAIGSSLSWAEFLRTTYNKKTQIVIPDIYPDFLKWLPDNERLIRFDKQSERCTQLFMNADLVFCMDFNDTSRVADGKLAKDEATMQTPLSETKARRVMIDHHLNPNIDTAMTISFSQMSSTCEIVFRLVWQLGAFEQMSKKWAIQVYCGMMTDTGSFTYNSTRPEIYFIISQLLTKGIDKDKIYRNVFNNYSTWAIRLRGHLLSQKLNVFDYGDKLQKHASYFSITRQEMNDYHFIKGDAEGLVNVPLQIQGMRLSISLREDTVKKDCVWVSLRSVDEFPANKIAEEFFNGGGHLNAAGGHLNCSMSEAIQITRQAIEKVMREDA